MQKPTWLNKLHQDKFKKFNPMDYMDYDFENQICSKCKKQTYCIKHPDLMVFLCQNCFTWAIGYADLKDKINKIYTKLGMEDLEIEN